MLKKLLSPILFLILFLTATVFAANNKTITDYRQTFFPCYNRKGDLRIAIRMYYVNKTPYYLVVNPFTFATEAAPATNFKPRKIVSNVPGYFTMKELSETPYMKALVKYTSPPYVLENQGITHAEKTVNAVFLTADMCPSVKPFEKDFFKTLVAMSEKHRKPMSIALPMTGLWIIGHLQEFKWLIKQVKKQKLKITWVNHSFSHVYYVDLPYSENFLLVPNVNTTHEILATEKLLLEQGQLPSVYFRFPGLVSNEKLVLKLRHFGLIPIGTDAWIAKNQSPKPGSIVLVHGNSNEPEGIKKVMPLLQNPSYHWQSLEQVFDISEPN